MDVAAAFRLQERPVDGMSGRVEKRPYPLPAGGEPVGVDAVADGIDQRFQFAEVEGVVVVEQQRADVIGVFAGIVDADRVPQPQIPRGGFVVARILDDFKEFAVPEIEAQQIDLGRTGEAPAADAVITQGAVKRAWC